MMTGALTVLALCIANASINGMKSRQSREAIAFRKRLTTGRSFFFRELESRAGPPRQLVSMDACLRVGPASRRLVQPLHHHNNEQFLVGPLEPQFAEYILYTCRHAPGVERRWRAVGRRGSKRDVGGCRSRDGGRSRSAEFERWRKFEQFQQWIIRWRRRRGLVSVALHNSL